MAERTTVQYIRYYTDGSAARQPEFKPTPKRRPLPKVKKRPQYVLYVQPVAMAGILISAVLLVLMYSRAIAVEIVLIALLCASMHGVNLMLIGQVPPFFARYGKVSTYSGILNACTYIGSALSTYGFAVLSDAFGWNFTIIGWCALALIGTVCCFIFIRKWKEFRNAE